MPSQQPVGQLHKQHNIQTQITMDNKQDTNETYIIIIVIIIQLFVVTVLTQQKGQLQGQHRDGTGT